MDFKIKFIYDYNAFYKPLKAFGNGEVIMSRKTLNLTEGSSFKLIAAFAVPIVLGNLFQQLYTFVDTMIVGHLLGTEALAGVGATGSLDFLIFGLCIGMCSGFAIPIAQRFGAKDEISLRKYAANSIYLSIVISVVMAVITTALCGIILQLMNTPENVLRYSYIYMVTILAGIPVTVFYNLIAGFIRSIGDSNTPFVFLLLATVLNIIFDYVFIAWLAMGVFGAAFATVLSQLIAGGLCLWVMVKNYPILHISGDEWKPEKVYMKKLMSMGLPMGLQYSITAIGSLILQVGINGLGYMAVAATVVGDKILMIFMCILDALGATMATYSGQNLGAGKYDRIRSGVRASNIMGTIYIIAAFFMANAIAPRLINIFLSDPLPEIVSMSLRYIRLHMAFGTALVFINVYRFTIQGIGYSKTAVLAGVFEMIARAIVGIAIIPVWGYTGACFASPLAWIFADIFLIPTFYYIIRRFEKL